MNATQTANVLGAGPGFAVIGAGEHAAGIAFLRFKRHQLVAGAGDGRNGTVDKTVVHQLDGVAAVIALPMPSYSSAIYMVPGCDGSNAIALACVSLRLFQAAPRLKDL